MKSFLLIFFVAVAHATDYPCNKKMDTSAMQKDITDAGITVDSVGCKSDAECTIYNASEDPSDVCDAYTYVEVDHDAVIRDRRAAAVALVKLLRDGTATQAQKDELLSDLFFLVTGQ